MAGGDGGEEDEGGVMVTVKVRYNDSESPTTSNPGPMFAEVDGTRILNVLDITEQVSAWRMSERTASTGSMANDSFFEYLEEAHSRVNSPVERYLVCHDGIGHLSRIIH